MTPARAFAAAAARYDEAATVQRVAAGRLARRIAALELPPDPRILEVGAGTGFLSRALAPLLPGATFFITDVAAAMVAEARRRMPTSVRASYAVMNAEEPAVAGDFDLVCSSFAAQWFADPPAALTRLASLRAPGGWLAISTLSDGTLANWHDALTAAGRAGHGLAYAEVATLTKGLPGASVEIETMVQPFASGVDFLRSLKTIGAAGGAPIARGDLRRALAHFERHGAIAEFRVATILSRRPPAPGLFVTGTDTGVGKTVVAACLAQRYRADYWKPAQTGIADGDDDTATVATLAGLGVDRTHPPVYRLQAPLSPEAAAAVENVRIDLDDFVLPATRHPIVVEGAGGVLVPLGGGATMADLIMKLGLPAVLVARSTLGTINHTLLSLQALRARGVAVYGVVLVGPPNPGNRWAIETHGRVRILAELPLLDRIDACTLPVLTAMFPPWPEDQSLP